MKKFVRLLTLITIVTLGISTIALGQAKTATEIIKGIRLNSIREVRVDLVDPNFMNVTVELQNENDMDIKLTESEFKFYIQEREPGKLLKSVYIGKAFDSEPVLLVAGETKDHTFKVDMDAEKEQPVSETIIHMLNFIGKPTTDKEEKDLFIKARFDLGMKSERGWSYGEKLRVEWMFCPEPRKDLPLQECFIEPVE